MFTMSKIRISQLLVFGLISFGPTTVFASPGRGQTSNSARALFQKACIEAVVDRKQHEALVDFDRAIQLDPNIALFYAKKGELLYHLQEDEVALETAQKAIALDQKSGLAWAVKGKSLGRLGRAAEGIKALTRATELDPKTAEVWNARGRLYSVERKWDLAEADTNKALQLNKTFVPALMDRISIREHLKAWPQVIDDCSLALRLDPSNRGRILRSRAGAYSALKDYAKAERDLKDALQIWPDDIRIHQELLAIYKTTRAENKAASEAATIQGLSKDF
ncbi:MAG: tetratricopeptide repeat protein [Cyanobacteria bacterium SZAS TMP-1]|nr:tetratricopeptide repeat protein [Cyanobacteria bacterium SZAS TMP-1]